MNAQIVIAIDGPAGAGKSSVARAVATRLGLARLDTGSMYRAVTWVALRDGLDRNDPSALVAAASQIDLRIESDGVWIDGVRREAEIRDPEVTAAVSSVSSKPQVRQVLVARQQELAKAGGAVIEGRDIGSVVCPWADLKIFLTATAQERALRRQVELSAAGHTVPIEDLARLITERDAKDDKTTPLRAAPGAIVVDSTGKTLDEVVEEIAALAERIQ